MNVDELEAKVSELLDLFYAQRLKRISEIKISDIIKRKNPYLYKAIGVTKASEIIEEILKAHVSSSDEGLFGNVFFEPLAKIVSTGIVSRDEGGDVIIETTTEYIAIAVKSGPHVFNSQSKKRQESEFKALEKRISKLRKHFEPIVGYCYGKKRQRTNSEIYFKEIAGQAFWEKITGDSQFYVKIVQLMKDKPIQHSEEFKKAFDATINKFTGEFINEYCMDDGSIDWEKLVRYNSGYKNKD
jgi:hypothetical protein